MTIRTNKRNVTFRKPFTLAGLEEMQPAGNYEVETDEELIEGLSFSAWKRKLTLIRLHGSSGQAGLMQTLKIDPADLDAALRRDTESEEIANFSARFEKPSKGASVFESSGPTEDPSQAKPLFQLAAELKNLVKIDQDFRAQRLSRVTPHMK